MSSLELTSLSREALEAWAREEDLPAYRGAQIFEWIWRHGARDFREMTNLPRTLREELRSRFELGLLEPARVLRSADGSIRVGWRLRDGLLAESVIIPEEDHVTLCISSQVGCALGCRFCATGRMGLKRNLTAGEIAAQALGAVRILGGRKELRNVVFMGMGEPLMNADAVVEAVRILSDPKGLDLSLRRITVSTSGWLPGLERLKDAGPVGLAVSLHAPDDELRRRLMPVAKRYPLPALMEALRAYPLPPRRRITIEYVLLRGVNDRPEHARALLRLVRGLRCKFNLIPFNPFPGAEFSRPEERDVEAFQRILTEAGYTAPVRRSRGEDIGAACGQLASGLGPGPGGGAALRA